MRGNVRSKSRVTVTFVLGQVADAVKIPNAALRFKPSREQMQAMREAAGRGSGMRGSGRRGSGMGSGMRRGADGRPDLGDKKMVWKLEDGKPKMVLIRPGLTDGSATEVLEGELQPGDQLITEISGVASGPTRRVSAF